MNRLNHPLFLAIRKEHEELRTILQSLSPETPLNEIENLLWNYEYLHHKKEEELIFKMLIDNPLLCEGGPMCVYYYDEQVVSPPREAVKKLIGQEVQWLSHQSEFQKKHTPLAVPIDEHRSTYSLLHYYLKSFQELSPEQKLEILKLYKRLQISHLEKEENCFFHVMTRLMNDQTLNGLWQKWQSFSIE